MNGHRIKLRGGWECRAPSLGETTLTKVTLPWTWPDEIKAEADLSRAFHRPAVDDEHESVYLEIRSAPGLKSATLNGRPLGPDELSSGRIDLEGSASTRRVLRLLVDVELARSGAGPWGDFAIVIGPTLGCGPERRSTVMKQSDN